MMPEIEKFSSEFGRIDGSSTICKIRIRKVNIITSVKIPNLCVIMDKKASV